MNDTFENQFKNLIDRLENIQTDTLKHSLENLKQGVKTSYHLKYDLVLIDLINHELKKRG